MTYTANIVFDQEIQGGIIYISRLFKQARFILIDTVDLPQEQAYELGFSLNLIVPIIGRTIRKNIALLPEQIIGIFDSFYVISLPSSLYQSPYDCECVVSLSIDANPTNLRIYAITSNITEETTNEKIDDILERVQTIQEVQIFDVAEDAVQVVNSISNNIAFGLLATSLTPITGGTSATALPPLSIGTSALTTLLLPGI